MKKRLKIAEQILIVLIVALILPLVIAGAIIVNTNQIAVRKDYYLEDGVRKDAIIMKLFL